MANKGRTAIVTGAGKRVGLEIARELLADGWAVVAHLHHDQDSVTQFPADYSRRTCDLLVLAGSRCRWVQQSGSGHTVPVSADGPFWVSEIGPFLWSELRLATAS